MALTETERTLANGLMAFGATKDMAAAILMLLDGKEACQEELIHYMVEHREAKPRKLLEVTLELKRAEGTP